MEFRHLTNLKVRVKKYPKGWVIQRKRLFWWVHLIGTSGMSDEPWYYSTKEVAIEEVLRYMKYDLILHQK